MEISREETVDVLVVGSGCAGFAAAVSAARAGADTLLIEKRQMLGGTATSCMVGPFMTAYDGKGNRQIVKGVFDELIRRLEKHGGAVHPSRTGDNSPYCSYHMGYAQRSCGSTPFSVGLLQLEMFDMFREAGVRILLNTAAVDIEREGDQITAVILFDGNDFRRIRAKQTVDCSGDAFIAYKAGAVTRDSTNENTSVQPMTLFYSLYNVDDAAVQRYIDENPNEHGALYRKIVREDIKNGSFPIARDLIGLFKELDAGEWRMNTTRVQEVSPLTPEGLTNAYEQALRQVYFLLDYCKKLSGLEEARLKSIASSIGVRESRRLQGVYTLKADDLTRPEFFPDPIALGSFPLDRHPTSGVSGGLYMNPPPANCFQIPYRVLVPEFADGLLVAGRCVSADRDALASVRVMPQCFAMGQAAGTAAALCAREGCSPRALPYPLLRKTLLASDAELDV